MRGGAKAREGARPDGSLTEEPSRPTHTAAVRSARANTHRAWPSHATALYTSMGDKVYFSCERRKSAEGSSAAFRTVSEYSDYQCRLFLLSLCVDMCRSTLAKR